MHYVIEQDGSIAFQGTPEEVENWLFENTERHNSRLRVRMSNRTISAWNYIGWKTTA
ncbi:hypothetical protein SEA_SCAP1_49 [Streptomyces phage Scap1]|uniref:Uncharacterized protein n=1 Tax=Streptomyces phage Scap1 TaxID=2041354 RepID=A0A2D1GP11_9CAUD|nr:hypothetical protein FDI71_gp49 [Streptomyces phage Scap1]ATN93698.1 hypothetical protein SEA_SCAP1_49 [Streptomyces phage Scap1]